MNHNERKGAARICDIPADVLASLNRGTLETKTLVEWLAIDPVVLLRHALGDFCLKQPSLNLSKIQENLASKGITERTKSVGKILADLSQNNTELLPNLSSHSSDMVRAWVAYAYGHLMKDDLPQLLLTIKPFAKDRSMATRECAWDAWRPSFSKQITQGLLLLEPWVTDEHEGVRRCAIEGTRPRGVWTRHIPELKNMPQQALMLLKAVKADPSRYVQNAVGNWLNDASKDQPEWVIDITARWSAESPCPETTYIVKRGLRTIIQKTPT